MFSYLTTLNLAWFLKETAPQTTTAKELWESLEHKYKTEDVGIKKFVVLLHDIHAEEMTLSETFQVAAIIEKLPRSWLAQKNTYTTDSAKANMVEHDRSKSNSKRKGKDKRKNDKKSKGKAEYLASKAGIANMVNDNMDMIAMVSDVIAMISEVNLVAGDNEEKLYMGNSAIDDIKGEGDVIFGDS
ncbi:hypothetical protein Tco_0033943 [Tanacetum coccineum]